MRVTVIGEFGYKQALLGMGLSYGLTSDATLEALTDDSELLDRLEQVASKLVRKGGSHMKFLESIAVWLDIVAPRYWWQQMSTYRIGCSTNSESTMHTLLAHPLRQEDFGSPIPGAVLDTINWAIEVSDWEAAKGILPEAFLQRRIVCTNYKTLRHIISQRHKHLLAEWRFFVSEILQQAERPSFLSRVAVKRIAEESHATDRE